MDQPRHKFLPRTGLTGEQYRDIGAGHQFDEASQLEHFRVRADERRQAQRQLLRGGPPGSTPAWLVRRRSSLRYLGVSAVAVLQQGTGCLIGQMEKKSFIIIGERLEGAVADSQEAFHMPVRADGTASSATTPSWRVSCSTASLWVIRGSSAR